MTVSTNALALALASLAFAAPTSAQMSGQYGAPPPPPQKIEAPSKQEALPQAIPGSGPTLSTGRKPEISKGAQKAIIELQTAVNANDAAAIPGKLAAAQAVAKTPDDRFVIASNQTKAAINANDLAGIRAGIEAMHASGSTLSDASDIALRFADLGKRYQKAQQNDQAAAAYERAISIDANSASALALLAGIRDTQGRKADAVALMQKSFAASTAKGQKVAEGNYKFAAKLAYDTRAPAAAAITREWVAAYPSPQSWRDALRIYRDLNRPQGDAKIDILRLARAANALSGESDFHSFASELVAKGDLAEAKAVLDDARTAPNVDLTKQAFKDLNVKLAKAPTRPAIDASAKAALAGATARAAIDAGDAYYGIGAYAEAAPLYRAALTKTGADANLANLRLGMALARAGDKAGATAALNAAGGAQADIAKYWLVWVAHRP